MGAAGAVRQPRSPDVCHSDDMGPKTRANGGEEPWENQGICPTWWHFSLRGRAETMVLPSCLTEESGQRAGGKSGSRVVPAKPGLRSPLPSSPRASWALAPMTNLRDPMSTGLGTWGQAGDIRRAWVQLGRAWHRVAGPGVCWSWAVPGAGQEAGRSRAGNNHVMLRLFPWSGRRPPRGAVQGAGRTQGDTQVPERFSRCGSVLSSSWVVLHVSCPFCVPWRSSQGAR